MTIHDLASGVRRSDPPERPTGQRRGPIAASVAADLCWSFIAPAHHCPTITASRFCLPPTRFQLGSMSDRRLPRQWIQTSRSVRSERLIAPISRQRRQSSAAMRLVLDQDCGGALQQWSPGRPLPRQRPVPAAKWTPAIDSKVDICARQPFQIKQA